MDHLIFPCRKKKMKENGKEGQERKRKERRGEESGQ